MTAVAVDIVSRATTTSTRRPRTRFVFFLLVVVFDPPRLCNIRYYCMRSFEGMYVVSFCSVPTILVCDKEASFVVVGV